MTQSPCPECGATSPEGMTCWDLLGAVLAWEYADPDLQAEHFLTVACYNLQHPAPYTAEAIAGLREALRQRLDHGVAVEYLRRQAAQAYAGNQRVRLSQTERVPVLRRWAMTIATVFDADQPRGAADRVLAWAAAIRAELTD